MPLSDQMTGVTLESCQDIIEQFEPCPENKSKRVLGIDGEWVPGPAVLVLGGRGGGGAQRQPVGLRVAGQVTVFCVPRGGWS